MECITVRPFAYMERMEENWMEKKIFMTERSL